MMLVLAPVCLGLSAVSIPATAVLLGAGWEPVAALIGISAVTALIASVGDVNAAIFGSKGKARFLFGWSVFSLAGNTAALLLAVPHGIVAIAWARLAMMLVQMPLHSWFLGRLLGRPLMTTLMPMARPLVAAGLMALGVGLFDHWLGVVGMAPLPRLVLGVGLGVPLYGGLILLVDRERVLKLKARVLKLRR
jgi:O-antigen/teichoic acid export membrane protein